MITKHFWKTLLIFTGMIIVALAGVLYINSMGDEEPKTANTAQGLAE